MRDRRHLHTAYGRLWPVEYDTLQGEINVEKALIDDHEQRLQDLPQRPHDHEQKSQPQQEQEKFVKTVEGKVKTALRQTYSDYTVPVQRSVNTDSCRDSSLDDMFVKLRLQQCQKTKFPETLSYGDVVEMKEIMQSADPIQTSQLFDKLHDMAAPRNVLILGKAGIGKTTLVKQTAKQWAEKKLWNEDVKHLLSPYEDCGRRGN
ncbi:hypothetical protein LSAT2_025609 [Lamellibrachia satsuma]|nr:hypothetical protein LSAT2_025609 [Lamellibrachia satsuma]